MKAKEETKMNARKGKTERELLELEAHWALAELSDYFREKKSPLWYETNKLIRALDDIRVQIFRPQGS